jgi:hypothetical protein
MKKDKRTFRRETMIQDNLGHRQDYSDIDEPGKGTKKAAPGNRTASNDCLPYEKKITSSE